MEWRIPDEIDEFPDAEEVPLANGRQASLIFIFITLLIDVLGFGVIIPVLPRLVFFAHGAWARAPARISSGC